MTLLSTLHRSGHLRTLDHALAESLRRLDPDTPDAVLAAAALHLAGAHVVDDALAGDAAAAGLLHDRAAGEHHRVLAQVVVDLGGGRVHGAAVVHLLAQLDRRTGEPGALDVAVALADVGTRGLDHQRALDDVDVAGEHARAAVGDHAVAAVGLHAHGLPAVGGLGHGSVRETHGGDREDQLSGGSGHW